MACQLPLVAGHPRTTVCLVEKLSNLYAPLVFAQYIESASHKAFLKEFVAELRPPSCTSVLHLNSCSVDHVYRILKSLDP